MFNESIVAIVFKLINFVVIVGIFVYVFKRYALSWIYQTLSERKKTVDDLEHMVNVLHAEHTALDRHMHEEEQTHQALARKLTLWNERFEQMQKTIDAKKQRQKELIEHKEKQQQQALAMRYYKKSLGLQAIAGVTERAQAKYGDEHQGHIFNKSIIAHLKKETI